MTDDLSDLGPCPPSLYSFHKFKIPSGRPLQRQVRDFAEKEKTR
jgi:hypothetical protein